MENLSQDELKRMQFINELNQPMYQEIPLEKPEQKFLEQLNPESICDYIEQKIRGRIWNREKGKWIDPPEKPKITEEGINEIMTRVMTIINPNTIYSNLDDEVIVNIVLDFGKELSRFLSLKYKEFGMDVVDINKITNFCCNMAYIALKRGEQALTLRMLRTMIQAKELTAIQTKPEEKRGFTLNPLKLFKK